MRIEQVRAFVVLAEELNFRRAAARLYVSQPALTAQITGLERTLGVSLFDRGPAGTRLTAEGAAALPPARELLRSVDDLAQAVTPGRTSTGGSRHGRRRVRIGVGPGGLGVATWATLHGFSSRRPDLEPVAVPLGFSTALPALDAGEVDALLLHGPVDETGCRRVATVGHVPVAVILSANHWLVGGPALDLDEVVPLVRALPPPQMGRAFARFWLHLDHPASTGGSLRLGGDDLEVLAARAARAGLVGFWPSDMAVSQVSGAVLHPLSTARVAPLQVVTREGWPPASELVAAALSAMHHLGWAGALAPSAGVADQHS